MWHEVQVVYELPYNMLNIIECSVDPWWYVYEMIVLLTLVIQWVDNLTTYAIKLCPEGYFPLL